MTNWTFHGPVIAAKDFTNADPGAAWAAHVVEKDGKFYFYATLNSRRGHFISVAVADTPYRAIQGKVTPRETFDYRRHDHGFT